MTPPRLHVSDRSRDERSLSAYLVLAQAKVPFERITHPKGTPDLPALEVDGAWIRGLADIADRVAALPAARSPWPPDGARARALVAQADGELEALRAAYPYAVAAPRPDVQPSAAAARDLAAIESIVNGSPHTGFVFGEPSVVDAALAPFAVRIRAYALGVGPRVQAWVDAVLGLPAMERWVRGAGEDAAGN